MAQFSANASLSTPGEESNSGRIYGDTIEKADLVCTGKVQKICMEKNNLSIKEVRNRASAIQWNQDTIDVDGKKIQGDWFIATFLIDGLIKGRVVSNEISIRFFCQVVTSDADISLDFFEFDNQETNLRYLVCLKHERENIYMFAHYNHTLMHLPAVPTNLTDVSEPTKRLIIVLQNAIMKGDNRVVRGALWTLKQIMHGSDLLLVLRALTKGATSESIDDILSERLLLDDTDVWEEIIQLSNNASYVSLNFLRVGSAIQKISNSKFVPYYTRLINTENLSLRRNAAVALSKINDKSNVFLLIQMLDNADAFVRYRALYGLSTNVHPMERDGKVISYTIDNHVEVLNLWKKWWNEVGQGLYETPNK
jgi:hypothetical protein